MDRTDSNGICFPSDVLLGILRRLPCRALAKSWRVYRAWRALIDAHKLLFPYYFPRGPFPGIFTDNYYKSHNGSSFFAPSPRSELPRRDRDEPIFRRPLLWNGQASVLHHFNSLLLLDEMSRHYVYNPATVRFAQFPPPSSHELIRLFPEGTFLAFDPAVSPHYQVFLLPGGKIQPDIQENTKQPCKKFMHLHVPGAKGPILKVIPVLVFSSRTSQWVTRELLPGHCAPGDLYDALTAPHPIDLGIWKSADYWHGSLYVHCRNNIIMILRNSEKAHDMVPLPGKAYEDKEYVSLMTPLRRSVFAIYEKGFTMGVFGSRTK